jgi:hypothetical protein
MLVSLLAIAYAASADALPEQVLLWPAASASPSTDMEDRLAAALRDRGHRIIPSHVLRQAPDLLAHDREEARALLGVQEELEAARQAYLEFQFADARRRLEALFASALPLLSHPVHTVLLGTALRLSAQVELADGQTDAARSRLATALRVAPDNSATSSSLPELRRLASDLDGEAARAGLRPFHATSSPTGATLYLDGRDVGVTPLRIDAAPGPHLLRGELFGHTIVAQFVHIPNAGVHADLPFQPDPANVALWSHIARGSLDPTRAEQRRALLAQAAATHLVSYHADPTGVSVWVFRPGATMATTVRGQPGESIFKERLAQALAGQPLLDFTRPAPQPGPPPPAPQPALYRRLWFWAVVGTAVSAAIFIPVALSADQRAWVRPAK